MTMNPSTPTSPVPAPPPVAPAAPGATTTTDEYEKLKRLVAEVEGDYQKAIGGNKAAGTRVRKAMQDIKGQAQTIRVRVLETRSTTP
jgi:hypothetical protein